MKDTVRAAVLGTVLALALTASCAELKQVSPQPCLSKVYFVEFRK